MNGSVKKSENPVSTLIREHMENKETIWYMSKAHSEKQTLGTSLGMWWIVIRDMIFFGIFTIFKYLMSGDNEIQGLNFIVYLISGKVAWFIMSEVINGGTHAILTNKSIVSNVKFPLTVLPTVEVLAIFRRRNFTYIFTLAALTMFQDFSNFKILYVIYYYVALFAFCIAYNIFFSAIITVSKDFDQLYKSITRILFLTLPLLWGFERIADIPVAATLLRVNPMAYLILGFRDAISSVQLNTWQYTVYFWCCVVLMFVLGSVLQERFKRYYDDYI